MLPDQFKRPIGCDEGVKLCRTKQTPRIKSNGVVEFEVLASVETMLLIEVVVVCARNGGEP